MSYGAENLGVDGHTQRQTHTDRQTQATTIPEGQNWPRVKSMSWNIGYLFWISKCKMKLVSSKTGKFLCHLKCGYFGPTLELGNSSLNTPMATKWCTKLDVALKRCPIVFQGHLSNFKVTRVKKTNDLAPIWAFSFGNSNSKDRMATKWHT